MSLFMILRMGKEQFIMKICIYRSKSFFEDKIFRRKTEYVNAVYCTEELKQAYEEIEYCCEYFQQLSYRICQLVAFEIFIYHTAAHERKSFLEEGVNSLQNTNTNSYYKNITFPVLSSSFDYLLFKDNG